MKSYFIILAVVLICMFLFATLPRIPRVYANSFYGALSATVTPPPAPVVKIDRSLSDQDAAAAGPGIPQAGAAAPEVIDPAFSYEEFPGLADFAEDVTADLLEPGLTNIPAGVYVPGQFALPIQQQPQGHAEYVATENNVITQFSLPNRYGVTGLLAHNYLSGDMFFNLTEGQDIILVYADGRMAHFRVTHMERFQALSPNSPFSQFISLSDADYKVLTSADLFSRVYTTTGSLVFQTCIQEGDEPSWGRLFVTAEPVSDLQTSLPQVGQFISDN